MQQLASHSRDQKTLVFLVRPHSFTYNWTQQHPPRLSTMRTMGGYFFPGAEK